jgi:hypothetical protein
MLNLEEMRHEKNLQGSSNKGSAVQDFRMKIFSTAFGCPRLCGSSKMSKHFLEHAMPLAMAASPILI